MGSGMFAKLGGAVTTKTAAVVAAGTLAVGGAAGAGVWYVNQGPQLAVVQRSTSVAVPAGGRQAAVVGCQAHETALSGGYAIAGPGFATDSHFIGGAWLAAATNPGDAPATLTAYALCVNARLELKPGLDFTFKAHAFKDRDSKRTLLGDGTSVHDLTTDGPYASHVHDSVAQPFCDGPGYTMVGTEFRSDRVLPGRTAAPVPLDRLTSEGALPGSGSTLPWFVSVNPGTELSTRPFPMPRSENVALETRIEDPQPPQANYAVGLRPICVKLNSPATTVTAQVTVAAGASADATVRCPKGQFVVGGGFAFQAPAENAALEAPQRYFGDGWLFAPTNAPTAGEPSGRKVRQWHVTGTNQQKPGNLYHNSVWMQRDGETFTGNGYFDTHAHGPDDQELRASAIPDSQPMIASAVCVKIDAEPTEPAEGAKPPVLNRPDLPPLDVPSVPGSAAPSSPTPSGSPVPGPSGSQSASPPPHSSQTPGTPASPGPNQSSPPPRGNSSPPAAPQSPAVSINEPAGGATLRRGCEESFAGTARTRPGGQSVTDPQYTTWQIKGPGGPVTLGAGASGRFLVPLLPDGTYPLVFTATDPAGGLTGSAQVSVRIVGCLR